MELKNNKMKETKEVLELAVSLIKAYKAAKADGKFNLADIQYLIDPALKLPPAFDNIGEIPKEWVNLQEADIQEVVGYVRQVSNDEDFIKLIYHLIGAGAAVVALTRKDTEIAVS